MINYKEISEIIKKSKQIVVLTGAGISAESGIKTFRDADGWWSQYNPMELASPEGFKNNPLLVLQWYAMRRNKVLSVEPNDGHKALVQMQMLSNHFSLITQNVDRLHQRAGSQNVIELHGNIIDYHCNNCDAPYSEKIDLEDGQPPQCKVCSGLVRPDVVWFGESLPSEALKEAEHYAYSADLFFSIGTAAEVYPAANLPIIAKQNGAFFIEINPIPSAISEYADLQIPEASGKALPQIMKYLL